MNVVRHLFRMNQSLPQIRIRIDCDSLELENQPQGWSNGSRLVF